MYGPAPCSHFMIEQLNVKKSLVIISIGLKIKINIYRVFLTQNKIYKHYNNFLY